MLATKLERVNFKKVTPDDPRKELALNAKQILGYSRLADTIAIPDKLMHVLRELEIHPLTQNSVAEYKQSKVKVGMYSGTRNLLFSLSGVGVSVSVFASGFAVQGQWSPAHYAMNCVCIVGCIASIVGLFLSDPGEGHRKKTEWLNCSLSAYTGNVPEFVLQKALQIKQKAPLADFGIHYLVETTEHYTKPMSDPFLVVRLGAELVYVDVWDEKEYELTM